MFSASAVSSSRFSNLAASWHPDESHILEAKEEGTVGVQLSPEVERNVILSTLYSTSATSDTQDSIYICTLNWFCYNIALRTHK